MDPDSRVALAEIKGDVKLVLAGMDRVNSDIRELRSNVRDHGGIIQGLRSEMTAVADHDTRITHLETAKSISDGERKGVAHSGRALWALIGLLMSAIGAGLLRHFGV